MNEQIIPATPLTPDEVMVMLEYSAFLKAQGLERQMLCTNCGEPAELGTGNVGWKCNCRILTWSVPVC